MIIYAVDCGKSSGHCITDNGKEVYSENHKFESLDKYRRFLKDNIELWKPDVIITCKPNRFYNTIYMHGKLTGILELEAERHKTQYMEFYDSEPKKWSFGTTKIDKDAVCSKYGHYNSDVADAALFCDYAHNTLKLN